MVHWDQGSVSMSLRKYGELDRYELKLFRFITRNIHYLRCLSSMKPVTPMGVLNEAKNGKLSPKTGHPNFPGIFSIPSGEDHFCSKKNAEEMKTKKKAKNATIMFYNQLLLSKKVPSNLLYLLIVHNRISPFVYCRVYL